jgi:Holliday junction resolvase-like predicted endonuclease
MTNSRNKGASGEREVAQELHRQLGMNFKRNLEQSRSGGGDLVCDETAFPFSIEVKRRASGWTCDPKWEAQAFRAAKETGQHPCVIYRFDRQEWRCRVWIDAVAESVGSHCVSTRWLETDMQGFAWIAREIMAHRAARTTGLWAGMGE